MSDPLSFVLATHNPHKVAEFGRILAQAIPGSLVDPYDGPEPQETGVTFAANALIKARRAAEFTGRPAIADDSGITVEALGAAPGVFSAYWAGHAKDATANLELLLDQLSDISGPDRGAHYTCVIALVLPEAGGAGFREFTVEGIWRGELATAPRGSNGFGYDPIFVPEGESRTAAELSDAEKGALSHRRRAIDLLLPVLKRELGLGA